MNFLDGARPVSTLYYLPNRLTERFTKAANASPFNKPELKSFVELIEDVRSSVDGSLISELVEDLMTRSGLTDLIRNDEEEERLENVKELINDIRNYEADHVDDLSLSNYLQDIALYTNVDMRNDSDVVRLMTMHQAKGLEFPYVFVCGLSEGIFPSHRSLRERQRAALRRRDAEQRAAGGDGLDAGTGKTAAREIKMGPLRESGGAPLRKEGWNYR